MTSIEHTSKHQLRAGKPSAKAVADGFKEEAHALVEQHLGAVFRNKDIVATIQEHAVEALPHPIFRADGQTLVRHTTKQEDAMALAGFESSLDTRGVYEDSIRGLMYDLHKLAERIYTARGKGIAQGM